MSQTLRVEQKLQYVFEVLGHRLAPHHAEALPALSTLQQLRRNELEPSAFDAFTNTLYNWIRWLDRTPVAGSPLHLPALQAYVAELESRRLQPASIARYFVNLQRLARAVCPQAPDVDGFFTSLLRTKRHGVVSAQCFKHRTAELTREHLVALGEAAGRASIKDTRTMAVAWMLFDTLLVPARLFGETKGACRTTSPLQRMALHVQADRTTLVVPASDRHNRVERLLGVEGLAWLARYHQLTKPTVWMFSNQQHRPLQSHSWLSDLWVLMHDAGLGELRVGVESCRRGAAKELLERGVPVEEICRRAQWSSPLPLQRVTSLAAPKPTLRVAPPRRPPIDASALRALGRAGHPPRVHRNWHLPTGPVPVTGDLFEAGTA